MEVFISHLATADWSAVPWLEINNMTENCKYDWGF